MKRSRRQPARSRSKTDGSPPAEQRPPSSPAIQGARSRKRLWIFRAVVLLLPLVALGLTEAGLRLAGYGFSTDFFRTVPGDGTELLTDNIKFGRWFFPPAQARNCAPFSIPATKASGTYRIFIFGESAAMGDPAPPFGFSRMIEVMLRDRYPGTKFEVVNTGITAVNSHVILPIAHDCAAHDGDLWLIYTGNNEVVGPYGAGTIFGAATPPLPLIHASMTVKSTRVGQGLGAWLDRLRNGNSSSTPWRGMQMFLDHQVAETDPRMERVYSHFENNLAAILRAGASAGVRQIVCTVGCNLKDCAPFASLHGAGFGGSQAADWERSYTNGMTAEAAGRFTEANEHYAQADRLDPAFAELQFRRGHCYWESGEFDEARRCFEQARDLDTLRFRADGRINRIIAQSAGNRTHDGIYFLDANALLATNSLHGICGEDLFYEHVHLTFRGNYLIARAAVDQIARLLPEAIARNQSTNDWLSIAECGERLGWNEWSSYQVVEEIHGRLQEPPFVNQPGNPERLARIEKVLTGHASAQKPEAWQKAAQQYRRAVEQFPEDAMLRDKLAELLFRLNDLPGAVEQWEHVAQLLPHHPLPCERLGLLFCQTGRGAESEKYFGRALADDPDSIGALNGMGMALVSQQRFAEAIQFYQRALHLKPYNQVGLRLNLTFALESLGKNAEAEQEYQEVLRLDPKNGMALVNLGALLLKQERAAEATALLKQAVEFHPGLANAQLGLAVALERQSKLDEAIVHFQEVLRLEPDNATAKKHLAQISARPGMVSPP